MIVFVVTALLQIQILVNLGLKHGQFLKTKEIREREYEYWSSVANQFPNVPDILYNAGVASINVGKKEKALGFLDKALRLDPLFIEAQQLRNNLFN